MVITGRVEIRTGKFPVIATYSRILVMDEAERARTLDTIRDFLDRQPETSAGEFTLPLLTVALRAVRRP